MNRLRTFSILGALMVLVAGCETTGPPVSTDLRALEQRAEQLVAAGELEEAAQVYAQLIDGSSGSAQVDYLIEGAEVLMALGNVGTAQRWLTRARQAAPPAQAQRILVLLAHVETELRRPEEALALLGQIDQPYPDTLIADILAAEADALFALGRVEEAVTTLVERELWLNESEEILDNHRLIWDGLVDQPFPEAYIATGEPTVDGWLALQPAAAGWRTNPFGLREDLLEWRTLYPDHPAAGAFLVELLSGSRLSDTYPAQIAVLLPLSGAQQAVARAIRDGFIAAHLSNADSREPDAPQTSLRFYDTVLLGTQEAYLRAQVEGADFIVGPLLKPEVEEIIPSAGVTPTLALNSVDMQLPAPLSFYQFALAPEDEAREVARYAIANGAVNAVALVQNSDWGIRLLDSFQEEFEALGGQLLQFRGYDVESQDFSLAITTLLNIVRSNQRRQRLAANLGVPLEFEPRRRQDVDAIFVAAFAPAGRLLLPQLRFHYAGDIPTYATSAVYESLASDADLNGVYFPDTPWVLLDDAAAVELKAALDNFWPERAAPPWTRFYGLGFDAYRLVPLLFNQPEGFSAIPALSGELTLGEDGRVQRRLPLAQFQNGRPIPIFDTPLEDMPVEGDPELAPLDATELAEVR